jgi:uncharacterized protein YbcV (DUF1398 family)
MTDTIENLKLALREGAANRPAVAGFPFLAETLRRAGVRRNEWCLPSLQRVYVTDLGSVVDQGVPLVDGMTEVPAFDSGALVSALRADQAGLTTFDEFVSAAWRAGVVRYVVDFDRRTCTYLGCDGQSFEESYPEVSARLD